MWQKSQKTILKMKEKNSGFGAKFEKIRIRDSVRNRIRIDSDSDSSTPVKKNNESESFISDSGSLNFADA